MDTWPCHAEGHHLATSKFHIELGRGNGNPTPYFCDHHVLPHVVLILCGIYLINITGPTFRFANLGRKEGTTLIHNHSCGYTIMGTGTRRNNGKIKTRGGPVLPKFRLPSHCLPAGTKAPQGYKVECTCARNLMGEFWALRFEYCQIRDNHIKSN